MPTTLKSAEVLSHYRRFLGRETRRLEASIVHPQAPSPVTIVEYEPASDGDVWAYATAGMCQLPMPGESDPLAAYAELLIFSNQQHDELVELLSIVLAYPFGSDMSFGPGDMIVGSQGSGVISGSPLTDILLINPIFMPDEFRTIHHSNGDHTLVLWTIPIHPVERVFAKEHGFKALLMLFAEEGTDTSNLLREPVV